MARILIVDDHLDTCRVMTLLVKHLGHEGYSVSSGAEALQHLTSHRADLIILDVMMPGMDGLEVLRRLREADQTKQTPVIMMTAVTDPVTRHHAMTLGANDYWIKATIEVQELDKRIKQHAGDASTDGPVHRIINRVAAWVDKQFAQYVHADACLA
jgi:CheY-like chemotaxis protein